MEVILTRDKVTKNSIRFVEDKKDRPIAIYLLKEDVTKLGDPETITVTIEKAD